MVIMKLARLIYLQGGLYFRPISNLVQQIHIHHSTKLHVLTRIGVFALLKGEHWVHVYPRKFYMQSILLLTNTELDTSWMP